MNNKIGLGLVTYNAPEKIKRSAFSVSGVDKFIIVNDGTEYPADCYPKGAFVIQHPKNLKVAQTKNDALKYLMDQGCEHIFLMEDDVIIKDPGVFAKYIEAAECSGILHLNYAYQGPHNFRPQINKEKKEGLLARTFNEREAIADPLAFINFDKTNIVALHRACVGAFSYFHRSVIEKSGYFDISFKNSWEHIDHTYRIIKDGFHPPFGWFADIKDSQSYLRNIENCMENSSIAKDPHWQSHSIAGEAYFKKKHGFIPSRIPKTGKTALVANLSEIYKKNNPSGKAHEKESDFLREGRIIWHHDNPDHTRFKFLNNTKNYILKLLQI
jgi:glycosyltransferase involved in cell wall biosynthesis